MKGTQRDEHRVDIFTSGPDSDMTTEDCNHLPVNLVLKVLGVTIVQLGI